MLDDLPIFHASDFELRPIQNHHAHALFTIVDRDRDYLRQYQNWPDTICSLEDMQHLIFASHDKLARNQGFDLVIYHQGQVVGKIGLVYIDWRYNRAEIGYWLAHSAQGHGLMTRAARLVTSYALGELELTFVLIRCAADNIRSRAIPARLGYHFEGILQDKIWIHGKRHKDTLYSMSAKRWYRKMIYHITSKQEWEAAQEKGFYAAPSLKTQGFIHLSHLDQIIRVANAVYASQSDLVILCVDPDQLGEKLREEPPDTTIPAEHYDGELFPHLYGELSLDAVMQVVAFPSEENGLFSLPEKLKR